MICSSKDTVKRVKRKYTRLSCLSYLQKICQTKYSYLEYIKNSYKSIRKIQMTQRNMNKKVNRHLTKENI